MIPLIGQEFLLATQIFSSLEKKVRKVNKQYFQQFLKDEVLTKHGSLTQNFEFMKHLSEVKMYAGLEEKKKETVLCLIEGLLIKLYCI